MGWLRTLFLGDIGNRLDIADTEEQIRKLRARLRKAQREKNSTDASQDAEIARLHEQVAQLELTIGALCSLMVRKQLLTESDLQQLVNSVDPEEDS
ncbi:MAG: hypothetical protein KDC95_19160 [Planctomycetes bacterium]|nr:hypothetical protein [Planctomycetota bacterium]